MSVDFIDSNVFIYLFDRKNAEKRRIAHNLIESAIDNDTGVISYQVVQETLSVMTMKLNSPPREAQDFLATVLVPMWKSMPSEALYGHAIGIQARYQFGFYDSLIVAAALDAGCTRLYTEDMQHGQQIEDLIVTNPFKR